MAVNWGPPKPNRKYDVKRLRRRLGLSQLELAKLIPTTERTVRRWERSGIAPQRFYIQRMQELEMEKFGTVTTPTVVKRTQMGKFAKPAPAPVEDTPVTRPLGVIPSCLWQ